MLNEGVEKMKLLIVGEWMFLKTYCFIYRCVQFIVLLKGEKKVLKSGGVMNKIGKNAKWRVNAFCSVCLCECVCVYKKKQVRWKQSDLYLMGLAFDVTVWSYLSQRTIVQWSKNIHCKLDWTKIIVDNRIVLWYTTLQKINHNKITWFLKEYLLLVKKMKIKSAFSTV